MKINLLVRDYKYKYGLSRYTASICNALANKKIDYSLVTPAYPFPIDAVHKALKPFGLNTKRFFTTYPLSASLCVNTLTHLTTQQMASLLWLNPYLHPTVVTVHDIVPHLVRHDREQSTFRHPIDHYFDNLAMKGLLQADVIIAISQFTRNTIIEALSCPEEKIRVIFYGLDHKVFKPVEVTDTFRARYHLPAENRYLVYVGAESPRKNLPTLLKVFSKLVAKYPELRLIKVGTPEYLQQYNELQILIQELDLENFVIFVDHPPEEDLVAFYNLADIFVFPSMYEGFGMPPLEAMACGTPVVCSNAASLPEVVGDAAVTLDPSDTQAWVAAIEQVLNDTALQSDLRERGLKRARQFTWERTAQKTLEVYQELFPFG